MTLNRGWSHEPGENRRCRSLVAGNRQVMIAWRDPGVEFADLAEPASAAIKPPSTRNLTAVLAQQNSPPFQALQVISHRQRESGLPPSVGPPA